MKGNQRGLIKRNHWDKSKKEFEVLVIEYTFEKYTRVLRFEPKWRHYRYYKTLEAAEMALMVFRKKDSYCDYPSFGRGKEVEGQYPNIKPTINISRFKACRRDDIS